MRPATRNDFAVAIICALPLEADAVESLFDKTYDRLGRYYGKHLSDRNAYINGRIGKHNVVLCYMPGMGKGSAATVAASLRFSYTDIKLALVVGICGGAPSSLTHPDIFLGDVVISNAVIEYDFPRQYPGGFQRKTDVKDTLGRPDQQIRILLNALSASKTQTEYQNQILQHLHTLQQAETRWHHPQVNDVLFKASYLHKHHGQTPVRCVCTNNNVPDNICEDALEKNCDDLGCEESQVIRYREISGAGKVSVHIGTMASADTVMKSAQQRDEIARKDKILAFEIEGAGVWDNISCIIIKGVCDYADSHKNEAWQAYAVATGASAAKAFLEYWRPLNHKDASKTRHLMIPFERNTRFVGRHDEIQRLEDWISMPNGAKKFAITGLGGVGKTQVALELAYRMRDREPECSIFWIPCTSYEAVEQACMAIAQMVGLENAKPAEVMERVKAYFAQKDEKWLLIFDNADDTDMWTKGTSTAPPLKGFLPVNHGHVIFTTRNRTLAVKLASPHVTHIHELDEKAGVEFLGKSLVRSDLLHDSRATITLLEQLTFLPLAITQAAAYINENGIAVSDYLLLLQEQETDVMELLSMDFGDDRRYEDVQNPIAKTWLISFSQIQKLNQLAAEYLSLMACVNPRNIPQSFLPQPASRKKMVDALGILSAYSFITIQPGNSSIGLHRLVHLATRNWMRKEKQYSFYLSKAADRLNKIFPDRDHTNRQLWREYLPHALFLLSENEFQKQNERYINFILRVATCLDSDGRYKEAERLLVWVMETQKQVLEPEHPDTLASMANLVSTYWNQGRWKEAEELGIQVMETQKQVLGPEHPSTLTSMANLALTYRNQGRWKEAEELLVQVAETQKLVLGPEHPSTLASMDNLASTYRNQGRWKKAEELLVQVAETQKLVLGPEHPATLITMNQLALTYQNQGQVNRAEKLLVHVLDVQERVFGPEHPGTLTSMDNLASILMSQGRVNEAEKMVIYVSQARRLDHSQTQTPPAKAASMPDNQESSTRQAESIFEGTTLVETQAELMLETQSSLPFDQKGSDTIEDEDCISVASNDDDIASQVATKRTEPEILAARYFGLFLAELKELRPLHEEALRKLGVKRFRENYRRILKCYVLKLRPEAYSTIEKDIVRVLKSRLNRINIAERILSLIQEEKENNTKPLDELISRPVEKESLEAWASNAYGQPAADARFDPEIEGYEQSDEDDENEDAEDDDCLYADSFLRRGLPFQALSLELRLLVLPASLREVLETTPKCSIYISHTNDTSLINHAKELIEDYTGFDWDWWPLIPRIPKLSRGRLRLQWKFCGETLYREISPEDAHSIQQILEIIGDHPSKCFCCETEAHSVKWTTAAFYHIWQYILSILNWKVRKHASAGTSPSVAHQRYTPGNAPPLGASTVIAPNSIVTSSQNSPGPGNPNNLVPGRVSSNTCTTLHGDPNWVVFGIKNEGDFDEIENIEIFPNSNDTLFFRELKRRYAKHRWLFQRWFSPFRFRHCRFVQFEILNSDHVYCSGEALPEEHGYSIHYEYNPRPPTAKNPLIKRNLFSILLKACDVDCPWAGLPSFLHKCHRLSANSHHWQRIPRKTDGSFELILGRPGEVAFGLEADYSLSFAILSVYHVLLIFLAFGFWIYWLKKYPNDLQNASVPAFIVCTLMMTFWGLFGIYRGFRQTG